MSSPNKILVNGTFTGSSSAGVIPWSPSRKEFLVGTVDTSGNVTVSRYSKSYQLLQTQVLNYGFGVDNHDVPSIIQMNGGKYLAVYNHHAGVQYSQLSTGANDIRSWASAVQVTASSPGATFQFLFQGTDTNHTVFLVTSIGGYGVSGTVGWGYYTTTDGSTWSSFNWIYQPQTTGVSPILTIAQDPNTPNTIHWFMGTNLAVCKLYHFSCVIQPDGSLRWYKTDGTDVTSTLGSAWTDETHWTPVYTTALNAINSSCAVVSGSPVVLYQRVTASGSNPTATVTAEQARWSGSAWVPSTIGALDASGLGEGSYAGPDYLYHASNVSGYPAQDPNDVNSVYLPVAYGANYAPSLPGMETGGGLTDMRMEKWTYNGTSWAKAVDISGQVNTQIVMGVAIQGMSPTQLLYSQGTYSSYTSFNLDLWAYPPLALNSTKNTSGTTWVSGMAPVGTQAYYLLYELAAGSGATLHDVSGNASGYGGSVTGGLTVSSGTYGNELSGFSTTQHGALSSQLASDFWNSGVSSYPRWVSVLAKSPSSGGTSGCLFSFGNTGNNAYTYAVFYNRSGAGYLSTFLNTNWTDATGVAGVYDGGYHHVLIYSTDATHHYVYFDGVLKISAATNLSTTLGNINCLALGALKRTTVANPFQGNIVSCLAGWGSLPDPMYLYKDQITGQFGGTWPAVATGSLMMPLYGGAFGELGGTLFSGGVVG
jgi:hypothetical protein